VTAYCVVAGRVRGLCLAALALIGCHAADRQISGLERIQESGELRVLVRPGFPFEGAAARGEIGEADLLRQLASRLGVELRWVRVQRHDQLLRFLEDGRGDLAVGRFSPAGLAGHEASATLAVGWVVDQLVTSAGREPPDPEELVGAEVHVAASLLRADLASRLSARGLTVRPVPEEVPIEEVLRRVSHGRYRFSVADSALVEGLPGLRVVAALSPRRPLVWAARAANGRLLRGVDDFLLAQQVLGGAAPAAACRDLDQVREAGVLRLVTRNSPTTCVVERGGLDGFEYRLASAFAAELEVRLEVVVPPPRVDPLLWLEQGFGDLLALHEPLAAEDAGSFLQAGASRTAALVSVLSVRIPMPGAVEDLAGIPVAASRPVASLLRLLPLEPAIDAVTPTAGFDGPAAIRAVSRGRIGVAVADEDIARLELAGRADLRLGPVVLPAVPLVWVANPSSPQLARRAAAFLDQATRSGTLHSLAATQLGVVLPEAVPVEPAPVPRPELREGAITPYDELLRREGERHGIDWRLLASIMFEESRFDPQAIGPGGAAGLFQFMPATWQHLGVEDPHDPEEAAAAASWYLKWLMEQFADLDQPDRLAMAIASYNAGAGHVFDAQRLAASMGFDPERWLGSVETALLLLDDPELASAFPSGVCQCRRAVGYTRRVLRRYQEYIEQYPR
jgi:membrane-bound lytic murein transglycosylase F